MSQDSIDLRLQDCKAEDRDFVFMLTLLATPLQLLYLLHFGRSIQPSITHDAWLDAQ